MTTKTETAKIVELAFAQWPSVPITRELLVIWHMELEPLSFTEATQALRKVLRDCTDWPPKIAQVMDAIEGVTRGETVKHEAEAAWDNICRRVLGPEGAEHHAKGMPMPPELFTSEAERSAWRKTHQTIRTSTAEVARRAFLAAYREAAGPAGAIERPLQIVREIGDGAA